jgi:hypothetical protein
VCHTVKGNGILVCYPGGNHCLASEPFRASCVELYMCVCVLTGVIKPRRHEGNAGRCIRAIPTCKAPQCGAYLCVCVCVCVRVCV